MSKQVATKPHILHYKAVNSENATLATGTKFFQSEEAREIGQKIILEDLLKLNPHKVSFFYAYIHAFKSFTQTWQENSGLIVDNPYVEDKKTPEIEI